MAITSPEMKSTIKVNEEQSPQKIQSDLKDLQKSVFLTFKIKP